MISVTVRRVALVESKVVLDFSGAASGKAWCRSLLFAGCVLVVFYVK